MTIPDLTRPEMFGVPDITAGRSPRAAWKQTPNERSDYPADRGTWLVYCPGGHPFWSWWVISLVSLIDIPGQPPAHFQYPGATHELLIMALSPEKEWSSIWKRICVLQPGDERPLLPLLIPLDLVHQFTVPNDASAIALQGILVERCMLGDISPDSDYASLWRRIIDATAADFRGAHGAQA